MYSEMPIQENIYHLIKYKENTMYYKLEVSAKKKDELIKKLEELGIPYTLTSGTTNNMPTLFHFEFTGITPEQIKDITSAYEEISNKLYKEGHYERKWDNKPHTLKQEIVGYVTGEAEKEVYVEEEL